MTEQPRTKIGPFKLRPERLKGEPTGRWFVDVPAQHSDNGCRRRPLFEKYSLAVECAEKFRELIARNAAGDKPPETFRGICRLWQANQKLVVEKGKKQQSSLDTDNWRLAPLLEHFKSTPIEKIVQDLIDVYQVKRLRAGIKPNSVQGETATLRKVLRWAHFTGKLDKLPMITGVGIEVDETEPLSFEEVQKVVLNLIPRVRPLVRFIAELGCRKGEAFGLTWQHVNLEEGWVLFKSTKRRKLKTKESLRRVYLSEGLVEQLRILSATNKPSLLPVDQRFVFPGRKLDQPLTNIQKSLAAAVRKAGILREGKAMTITLKTFRTAYASLLANEKHPDVVIQANMGHAPGSKVTRKHYERAHDVRKRAAVIDLEVPLSVAKKDGRWQSKPESWQSTAMPEKVPPTPETTS